MAAVVGGVLSSLTGTGANILVFLFLVVLADVLPKAALPTAIMVMTSVSLVGLALFGIYDGQLDVEVAGDRVVAVGGAAADLDHSVERREAVAGKVEQALSFVPPGDPARIVGIGGVVLLLGGQHVEVRIALRELHPPIRLRHNSS